MEISGFSSCSINSLNGVRSDMQTAAARPAAESETSVPVQGDKISLGTEGKSEGTIPLRILHINDVHGAVAPDCGKGGLAKAATVIERERENAPGQVLTLNAGDLAEGSMVSYLTKGAVVTEAMAEIGFDAIEPGNHDFAWGQETLQGMLADTKAPILNASITRDDGTTFGEPIMIKDVGGVKIGMVGLDVEDMSRYVTADKLEGLHFGSSAETLKEYIPKMKEAGADVIMVLSHIGFDEDQKIAEQFPEIDVIVGGHSHTELPEGHYVGNTLIVQTGTKGQFVGEVDLDLDLGTKKIANAQARLIPIDESIEPDPEVSAIIQAAADKVADVGSKVMGQAAETLHYSHSGAAKINQIHADSVLQATGADIALVSCRNPRGNIEKGEVTYEKLFNSFPHTEEDIVIMKCPGRLLLKEMESRVKDGGRGPATPAGFTYTYDVSKPDGERIVDVRMDDGSKFDPDREYTVATTISMARKSTFKEVADKKIFGSSQEVFMDYFAASDDAWKDNPDNRVTKLGA